MLSIDDLQPGDILIHTVEGRAYHAMLYSPIESEVSNIIHMGYGSQRSGLIKSTLNRIMMNTPRGHAIQVIRSNTLDGKQLAAQAEHWLRQGVAYDELRFVKMIEREYYQSPETSVTTNVRHYLKYAARRETMPMKPAEEYPYLHSGMFVVFLCGIIHPVSKFPLLLPFYLMLLRLLTNVENRPRGFTCIGLILAVVGAVALRDEVEPINEQSGWNSIKHAATPFDSSLIPMIEKLSPSIAEINPQFGSVQQFFDATMVDRDHWNHLGVLTKDVPLTFFYPSKYREEKQRIERAVQINRKVYDEQFKSATTKCVSFSKQSSVL